MRLRVYGGLGDTLAALPVAYACAEHGEPCAVQQFCPPRTQLTMPPVADLGPLPLLGKADPDDTKTHDLTAAWNWIGAPSLLDVSLARLGLAWGTTPRVAELQAQQPNPLGLKPGSYVVVCASAHYAAEAKGLSEAQLRAVRECGVRHSFATVLVGDTAGDRAPVDYDLRGQTSIRELVALVGEALAVVSVDTGVLHLAGAMHTPLLALCGVRYTPVAALQDYYPLRVLQAPKAAQIAPERVADNLSALVRAARVRWCVAGPSRVPDGPAEVGRVAAKAAGVPFVPLEEASGWCVAEAIDTDTATLAGLDLSRMVLSLHAGCVALLPQAAGVMYRGRNLQMQAGHLARRGWYVPLPSPWVATQEPEPGTVGWHGILHPRKELEVLTKACAVAGKRLVVCGSEAQGHTPDGYADNVRAMTGDVEVRPWWSVEDLQAALSRCEVLCYPDTMPKEQSAASTDALGLGRPVVVGAGMAHDDVRGWTRTGAPHALATALSEAKPADGARALLGASYRRPWAIARQYRAAVQQAALDALR